MTYLIVTESLIDNLESLDLEKFEIIVEDLAELKDLNQKTSDEDDKELVPVQEVLPVIKEVITLPVVEEKLLQVEDDSPGVTIEPAR